MVRETRMREGTETVQEYAKPTIVDYGDLNELTAGMGVGDHLDRDFPRHTPKSELTFSNL
jgi:hypothetical protein